MPIRILLLLAALAGSPAFAEVAQASASGFVLSYRQDVQSTPARAFEAVGRIAEWWNASHTYSGQASNLKLGLRAGDCFCEQWDGNSIEHARVIHVRRDSAVRLDGGLGPLQDMGVSGVLTFTTGVAEGKTFVQMRYVVRSSPDAALDRLAPVVDRVMGEQFGRWASFAERP